MQCPCDDVGGEVRVEMGVKWGLRYCSPLSTASRRTQARSKEDSHDARDLNLTFHAGNDNANARRRGRKAEGKAGVLEQGTSPLRLGLAHARTLRP